MNKNNNTSDNIYIGRGIRHAPLQLDINVLGSCSDLNDSIQTPRNAHQQENIKSSPTNTNLINDDQSDDCYIITIHSSDTSYTPSDTLTLLNEPIPDNNNHRTIETDGEQTSAAQTRSRL